MTKEEREKAIEIFIKRAKCRATSVDDIIEGTGLKCGETACEKCPLYYVDDELYEAEKTASKALEQEPCDDCISRQAVLEYIEGSEAELGHSSENELVCQDIKNLSSITPTQKRGSWIERFNEEERWLMCTECRQDSDKAYNFCPNCGADMREEWTDEVIEKQGNKLIECMATEAYKIANGNIDKARKIMAGKISEEEEKQLIFGADMRKEQSR